jgi:hypothetical protein
MIRPGYTYNFEVVFEDKDYYKLLHDSTNERVQLNKNNKNRSLKVGFRVKAFVYVNKENELIATTEMPKVQVGEVASLKVKTIVSSGAFLDWGLPNDLFWPNNEQPFPIKEGYAYPVALVSPGNQQLIATGNIYNHLESSEVHKEEDMVSGTVYDFSNQWGVFVAVEDKYFGLIPNSEIYQEFSYGDKVYARIMRVREDGKLDLSLRKQVHEQLDDDAEFILDELIAREGFLPLNDKSSPEEIKEILQMSKGAFKRAVGRLLKYKKIKIAKTGIRLIDEGRIE